MKTKLAHKAIAMRKLVTTMIASLLFASTVLFAIPVQAEDPVTINYGVLTLSAPWTVHNWTDVWDLTKGDLTLSYTIDMTGLKQPGTWNTFESWQTSYTEVGLRGEGASNFNPGPWDTYQGNCGGWMTSDCDTWNDGDGLTERGVPKDSTQDLDDKHNLAASGGRGERDYDVLLSNPDTVLDPPIGSWSNYGIWFDRDGVDQWQANFWGAYDGKTYNTGGIYDIVITYHAINDGLGVMFATVNGVPTGFYSGGLEERRARVLSCWPKLQGRYETYAGICRSVGSQLSART